MASHSFQSGLQHILNNGVSGATWKMLLCNATDAGDKDNDFVADVTANELSDASYGRQTLTSVTVSIDDTSDFCYIDCADVTFAALDNETAASAYIYIEVTNDADSVLVARLDHANVTTNGTDVIIVIHAQGFLKLAA